ncbi:MAG: DUF488 domain-containing protein [Anaerolineales bacterium]|nr:DUF488 domain-containing protein [Anaerolineales bacterium]
MKIFTIGFTQKRAETFFEILRQNNVQRLVDIRLRPNGQLSGFAKKDDLPYFLANLANGCQYIHIPDLAPAKEILKDYRLDSNWERYEIRFDALMDERRIPEILDRREFENFASCLLCSEATPEQCHRRLVAERLRDHWPDVEIIHL